MKCQLNALEILAKDKLKNTLNPDVGEMIPKEKKFFFLKKELYLHCFARSFKSLVNFKETNWKAQKIHHGYGLGKKDSSQTLISTLAQRKGLVTHRKIGKCMFPILFFF